MGPEDITSGPAEPEAGISEFASRTELGKGHSRGNLFFRGWARNYDLSVRLQGMISQVEWAKSLDPSGTVLSSGFPSITKCRGRGVYMQVVRRLWCEQEGQDIAEYAVMLAVILVIVVGTVTLIGSNANNVFSQVASSIQ